MENTNKTTSKHKLTKIEIVLIAAVIVVLIAVLVPTIWNLTIKNTNESTLSTANSVISSYITNNANAEHTGNVVVFVEKDGKIYAFGYSEQKAYIETCQFNAYEGYTKSGEDMLASATEVVSNNIANFEMEYDESAKLIDLTSKVGEIVSDNPYIAFAGKLNFGINTGVNATYTITYVAEDNVSNVPEAVTVNAYGTHIVKNDIPTRDGYVFAGWKNEESGEIYLGGGIISEITENMQLSAVWNEPLEKYTLTFEADAKISFPNGFTNGMELDCGTEISKYVFGTKVSGTNAEFVGWEKIENGVSVIYDENTVAPIILTSNTILTAVWKNDAKISFNAGSGDADNMPSEQTLAVGEFFVVGDTTPIRVGYQFFRWTDENGTCYKPGSTIRVTKDMTLTAKWVETAELSIEYIIGGSAVSGISAASQSVSCVHDGTYEIRCAEPTREGYRFNGWRISVDKVRISDDGLSFTYDRSFVGETVCITASWLRLYNVYYQISNGNGITQHSVEKYVAGEKVTTVSENFTQQNYTFTSWEMHRERANAKISSKISIGGSFTMPAYDVFLNTGWTKNDRRVEYAANSPTGVETDVIGMPNTEYAVTADKCVASEKVPTCEGYVFCGWVRTDSASFKLYDGTTAASIPDGAEFETPDVDIVLNATWEKCYKVTYTATSEQIKLPTATERVLENDSVMVSFTEPVASDSVFECYNITDESGAAQKVDTDGDGETDTDTLHCGDVFTMPSMNIVLNAKMSKAVTISYVNGGAIIRVDTKAKDDKLVLPTIDGISQWTTTPWKNDGDNIVHKAGEELALSENVTLYSVTNFATARFVENGNEIIPAVSVTQGSTFVIPATIPTSANQNEAFSHWTCGDATYLPCDIVTMNENMTFSPTWIAGETKEYTVTVNYHDVINEEIGEATITLPIACGQSEFVLTASNACEVIEGLRIADAEYSQKFVITDGGISPNSISADVIAITTINNIEYKNVTSYAGLCAIENDLSGNYIQTQDIDLSGVLNFVPIGLEDSCAFLGTYDGNGFEIRNLSISQNEDRIGLFSENNGTIKNITITIKQVMGKCITGGVCGINRGSIENCNVSVLTGGTVATNDNVTLSGSIMTLEGSMTGGVCGMNLGSICKVSFFGNVDNTYAPLLMDVTDIGAFGMIGGISGLNFGSIDRSNAYVNTMQSRLSQKKTGMSWSYVGGITGVNCEGTVANCWARAGVLGYRYVGGLVGFCCGGSVESCWSKLNCYAVASGQQSYFGACIGVKSITTSARLRNNCYEAANGMGIGMRYDTLKGVTIGEFDTSVWSFGNDTRPQLIGFSSAFANAID